MTLHLTYSNHFEALIDALCENLERGRSRGLAGVFTPAEILVPNYSVAAYLKYAIARRTGVAANLSFQFMQNFIASRVSRALEVTRARAVRDGESPETAEREHPAVDLRVIDKPQLHALLCSVLADEHLLQDDVLAPVKSYLQASGTDKDAIDLRRYQLAEQLATLFADYSLSRPTMLRAWPTHGVLQGTRGEGVEVWQRQLYLAIFGPFGALERVVEAGGPRWITGPALFDQVLAKDLGLPRNVHVVGFSYMPFAHHQVLARMARASTVHVYALNPCMEYWEDLQSGWEVRLAGRQWAKRGGAHSQLSFGDIEDTPPLRLWGRPGRENVRILDELTQCDFEARFVDPVAPPQSTTDEADGDVATTDAERPLTMLWALQRDILFREPERSTPHPDVSADDDSIRVLGCPSVQRELEVVGNEIWRLLSDDDSLRCNDIAVLVSRADQALYQAHIPAVFGQLHEIPHHVVDVPLESESRIIEAFYLLIELPFGRFTRPELLRLLTHPAVLARYPGVDASDWIHWSERLGIVHGADHDDHTDTYIDKDVFNWQQGIRRLALGAFMAADKSGEAQAIECGSSQYLPEELPPELLPSAARFALVTRSLISDARYCRTAEKSLYEWRIFFEMLLSSYLASVDDNDERNLTRVRDAIAKLGTADIDGRPVSYRIASEFLRSELDGSSGAIGEYLADGVTVAPLLPMRPIPYRVIFMVGLGEGRFPASERESPLDLRAAKRRRGDVAPRERDRYLFLETLLCARERLYLSYVSRNEQTGETLQPSSVVLELSHILGRGYATEGSAADRIAIHHPLRRYDPRYFPALFEAANGRKPLDSNHPESQRAGAAVASETADGVSEDVARDAAEPPMISVSPSAHRQANALALRRHLEGKLREQGQDMPSFAELRRVLKNPRFSALRQRLGLMDIERTGRDADEPESTVSISLNIVRKFLESPLQAWASAVLRLRESELTDLIARRDEAFATPLAPMVGMLRDVFSTHLTGDLHTHEALLGTYQQHTELAELSGNAPIGVFSSVEAERHHAILERWRQHVLDLSGDRPERFQVYSFGRAPEHRDVERLEPPIVLRLELPDAGGHTRTVDVELFGRTQPVGDHTIGSLVLTHHDRAAAQRVKLPKYLLRGLIDHVALSAAGIVHDRNHRTTVMTAGDKRARYDLAPWSQDDARAYLSVLVGDLLGASHEYLLPCEAVFDHLNKPDSSVYGVVEKLKSKGQGMSSLYGPIADIEHLHAPYDADLIIERRFAPLMSRLQTDLKGRS